MTLENLIERINRMKPDNRFSNEDKVAWANEIEGRIQQEAFLQPAEIIYDWETDKDTKLLLNAPHDSVYEHFLRAQLSYANEEYDLYQNEMEMFNKCWASFMLWVCNAIKPAYRKTSWVPKVYLVVRGEATMVSFFELPVADDEIADFTLGIWQRGEKVLSYGMEDLVEGESGIHVEIPTSDSAKLNVGAAKMTLTITDESGNKYEHYPCSRLNVQESEGGAI